MWHPGTKRLLSGCELPADGSKDVIEVFFSGVNQKYLHSWRIFIDNGWIFNLGSVVSLNITSPLMCQIRNAKNREQFYVTSHQTLARFGQNNNQFRDKQSSRDPQTKWKTRLMWVAISCWANSKQQQHRPRMRRIYSIAIRAIWNWWKSAIGLMDTIWSRKDAASGTSEFRRPWTSIWDQDKCRIVLQIDFDPVGAQCERPGASLEEWRCVAGEFERMGDQKPTVQHQRHECLCQFGQGEFEAPKRIEQRVKSQSLKGARGHFQWLSHQTSLNSNLKSFIRSSDPGAALPRSGHHRNGMRRRSRARRWKSG